MAKFNSFDRKNLQALRAEMTALLEKYGATANLEFEMGGMKFDSTLVEVKIKAKVKGAETREDLNLKRMAAAYNLVLEKNGARLVRYDTKKYKMPFIYEKGGKMYKTTTENAKLLFAA